MCSLYEVLVNFEVCGITHVVYAITYSVFFSKVKCYFHTSTKEARSSRTVVQKLLLEGNCRNECVKKLKIFSLQLQVMKYEEKACGRFSLNCSLFVSVVSVIVSCIIVMVQIK